MKYDCPRSLADARRLLIACKERDGARVLVLSPKEGIVLREQRGNYSVFRDGNQRENERVTFLPDGRIRLVTFGDNTAANVKCINACLPPPYHVFRDGETNELRLSNGRRTIARFLSSTVFTPEFPVVATPDDDLLADDSASSTPTPARRFEKDRHFQVQITPEQIERALEAVDLNPDAVPTRRAAGSRYGQFVNFAYQLQLIVGEQDLPLVTRRIASAIGVSKARIGIYAKRAVREGLAEVSRKGNYFNHTFGFCSQYRFKLPDAAAAQSREAA